MYIIKKETHNRYQRRSLSKEIKYIKKKLGEIIEGFLKYLFNDNIRASYKYLYEHFLDYWNDTIHWINDLRDFKYIEIDSNYFIDSFRPLEKQ